MALASYKAGSASVYSLSGIILQSASMLNLQKKVLVIGISIDWIDRNKNGIHEDTGCWIFNNDMSPLQHIHSRFVI
jgi:hypothetical protein